MLPRHVKAHPKPSDAQMAAASKHQVERLGTMMLGSATISVVLSKRKPCDDCRGPAVVTLSASMTGFSVGSGYQHHLECPKLYCEHGLSWSTECYECEIDEREEHEGLAEEEGWG